jgi:hypothetical protein
MVNNNNRPMGKLFRTATAIVAVLIVAAGTVSAQDKKKVEKMITVVTVDDNGVTKDTTIITTDTLEFNGENIIINTREGKRIMSGSDAGDHMMWIEKDEDEVLPGRTMMQQHMMMPMRMAAREMETREGVNYHLSVDGVVVTIRAPKDKTDEADKILEAAKKVLMKK